MAVLIVQLPQALFEFSMHMVGVLGLDLDDDRQPRLAADERRQAARARRPQHGVALEVAQPQPLFDDLGAIADAGGIRRRGRVFRAGGTFTAAPQQGFPVPAVLVLLDPGVDRLRRHAAVIALLSHPARDLFRCPLARQSFADGLVDLGILHLPHEGSFTPPALGLTLRLGGIIFGARAIAPQFTADRGRTPPQGTGDFLLVGSLVPQLRYAVPFFHRKMRGHRWDSVPKEKFARPLPLERPSDVFSDTSFRGSVSSLDCV